MLFWLLLIVFSPIGSEMTEWGEHFVADGDFVHAVAPTHQEPSQSPEHGCSPVQHVCGCHGGLIAVPSNVSEAESAVLPPHDAPMCAPEALLPQARPEPGIRPPIA